MKLLFISHTYPPILGGVESQNYNLAQGLSQLTPTKIIANGRGKIFLPIFLPITFLRTIFLMARYDVCLLGNGVLAPIGAAIKFFYPKKKFFCVVHGLDITFANKKGFLSWIYRHVNIPSLKQMNQLIMVGRPTVEEAIKAGIEESLCTVIPNGVNSADFQEKHSREELSKLFGSNVSDKKVILRLGRFVPHKGTHWFIENIMPKLPKNVVMIATGYRVGKKTAGDADNFLDCENAIINNNLQERVKLLPSLPQPDLKILLNTVDLVVAPNVPVPGTMEGFGINVIEAGACGRVVIAANLEGLAEAIQDGKNGILLQPQNVDQWVSQINEILSKGDGFLQEFGQKSAQYVQDNYAWDSICQKYLNVMKK